MAANLVFRCIYLLIYMLSRTGLIFLNFAHVSEVRKAQ